MKPAFIPLLLLAAALPAAAQSLDESVSVTGRYQAEVIPMERLAAFPPYYPTALPMEQLEYDLAPHTLAFTPSFFPHSPAAAPASPTRGYLQAELGSWLNAGLRAGWWLLPGREPSSWKLGAWLDHRSTSLWRAPASERTAELGMENQRRRLYDERLGLTAGRTFGSGLRLSASVRGRLAAFNYYNCPAGPSQTFSDLRAEAALQSSPNAPTPFSADLSVAHSGWRTQLIPGTGSASGPASDLWPSRETVVTLGGSVASTEQSGNRMALSARLWGVFPGHGLEYGLLQLCPSYEFEPFRLFSEPLHLRLGVAADLSAGAGNSAESFSFLHVAPDCRAWVETDHATLYARATGGAQPNTVARSGKASLWSTPHIFSTVPLFSPVDAALGFEAGPASSGFLRGLEGGLEVRWKAMAHLPLEGWYPSLLESATLGEPTTDLLLQQARGTTTSGVSIAGKLGWSAGPLLKVSAIVAWQPQGDHSGYWNGTDRPEWTGEFTLSSRPMERLTLEARLDWRAGRRLYGRFGEADALEHLDLPHWLDLGLRADWHFSSSLSAGVKLTNLTCRRNLILPGLPTERLCASATLQALF